MSNIHPRVSHLSDARQVSSAVNHTLKKTDPLSLSSDQLSLEVDRDGNVTGDWNISGVYKVATVQVVGARIAGWTAATGTPARGAFAAAAAGTASAAYVQAELQGALNRVAALEARLIAYDADLRTHGLIGT